jgi:Flp pilus assembly pilin Flp
LPVCVNRGQSTAEYGLIVATVAVLVLMGMNAFGNAMHTWFDVLASRIVTSGT